MVVLITSSVGGQARSMCKSADLTKECSNSLMATEAKQEENRRKKYGKKTPKK